MTGQQLIEALNLECKCFDWSRPHSFNQDMLKLYPGTRWSGVWMYEDCSSFPRPLTETARVMLIGFNQHFGTFYPTEYEVIQ